MPSWAVQKQALYALIVLSVLAVVIGTIGFFFFYKPASCADGIQNQKEEGIDCGGMCDKLCMAPRVSALWARAVPVADGVYHAVAMVQNPETAAGTESLPYSFSLYDGNSILIAERGGVLRLLPGEVIPLLETNIVAGSRIPVRTFVTFGNAEWRKMERPDNVALVDSVELDQEGLRLSARVTNTSATALSRVVVTALLYNANDIVIGASQTILSGILPRQGIKANFTWQQPFPETVVRSVVTSRIE